MDENELPAEEGDDYYYDPGPEVDGNAEMQKTEDQELEARFAEICAKDPTAPFC